MSVNVRKNRGVCVVFMLYIGLQKYRDRYLFQKWLIIKIWKDVLRKFFLLC